MVMKKFTTDDFARLSFEDRQKVTDWIVSYKFNPEHVAFIEQTNFEDDPILENVKLMVWTLLHHRYIPAEGKVLYIYEQDDFGDLIYAKYAEMEVDDFPWEVIG